MPLTTGQKRGVPLSAPERRHVFISYSHADRDWLERLQRMMAPLLRDSGHELRLWDDSQIRAGRPWREAIEAALAEAKVALLKASVGQDHVQGLACASVSSCVAADLPGAVHGIGSHWNRVGLKEFHVTC